MSVAGGAVGTGGLAYSGGSGGGFMRVNGNPLEQDGLKQPGCSSAPPPQCPNSPYPPLAHSHNCSATANRELQCILKELKFITNRCD